MTQNKVFYIGQDTDINLDDFTRIQKMAYLANSQCRSLDVTESFNLAGTDIVAALNALQSSDLLTTAAISSKQDALANIGNVSSINQNLSTTSNVRFNQVNFGANGFITLDDGGAQLLISGGLTSSSRYLVLRPYSPASGGSACQYTANAFQITKTDGSAVALFVNTATGDTSLDGLAVTRAVTLGSAPTAGSHATRKDYVDALGYLTASTGLTKTGSTLSVNAAQTQITSIGTLSTLTVSGVLTANTGSFSGAVAAATATLASHLTRKDYVDALGYLTASTGLTKTASTLSVNAAQPQITSVGALTTLVVSGDATDGNVTFNGTADTTALGNGSTVLMGGMSVAKKLRTGGGLVVNSGGVYVTGNSTFNNTLSVTAGGLNITGVSTFSNSMTCYGITCQNALTLQTEPTLTNHATTKNYVDTAITTANTKISSGIVTNSAFSISGLTFTGLTKELRYSKVGSVVTVSFKASWTSATGTLAESNSNTLVDAPFASIDSRIVEVGIQKDSFFVSRTAFMDANLLLQARVNAADVPGYNGATTLMLSWTYFTTP